ncbi:unnamed protein product [Dovyalis caffra]|uniref:Uncharacterized protein n=1 Tax=Dovyalis caffra TaxID=77055 RepID=A0AAV1RLB8_9ROSI|nr:unnamed protein product [Dovyalis caffra]
METTPDHSSEIQKPASLMVHRFNQMRRRSDHNNQGGTRPAPNGADLELQRRDERNILELYRAAFIGDWDSARGILEQDAEAINARITGEEDTALHIAAAAGHTYFVRQLVNKMSENNLDLGLTNGSGNTAFCLAAVSGIVEVAEVMMGRNRELAKTRGKENMLPLEMAVSSGQRKMARYLYDATKDQLNDSDQKNLFVMLVDVDIARQMLQADSNLAIAQDRNHETALHVLTRKPLVERRQNSIEAIASLGVMKAMSQMVEFYMYGVQKNEALGFVKDLWAEAVLLDHSIISSLIGLPGRLLFTAAEQGNSEFLKIVIRSYPDVVFKVDEHQRSIFHISVLHRHENVFELIHDLGSEEDRCTTAN